MKTPLRFPPLKIPPLPAPAQQHPQHFHITPQELKHSAEHAAAPPADLSPELQSLWFTHAGRWEEAHHIAQEIHTPEGSWLHALLHLIEGDPNNAGYWYARAGRKAVGVKETAAEWDRLAAHLLEG